MRPCSCDKTPDVAEAAPIPSTNTARAWSNAPDVVIPPYV